MKAAVTGSDGVSRGIKHGSDCGHIVMLPTVTKDFVKFSSLRELTTTVSRHLISISSIVF